MNEKQMKVSERIYWLVDPWDKEPEKTTEEQINDIYNLISLDPVTIINDLLDRIDELNA